VLEVCSSGFCVLGYYLDVGYDFVVWLVMVYEVMYGWWFVFYVLGSIMDVCIYIWYFDMFVICFGFMVLNMYGIDELVEIVSIVVGVRMLGWFLVDWFEGC